MNIPQRLTNAVNALRGTQNNSLGLNPAQEFLRYGPQRTMTPDFSQLLMSDKDKYTGYMYGAVTRRANKVVTLAKYNIKTKANDATTEAAKRDKATLVHPYVKIIDESLDFANNEFWREIQSYVDIRGEYFLMAVRGKAGTALGEVKQFKLLNPYDITIVRDGTQKVIGYTEARDGMFREIPPHMIIHMHGFNPFSRRDPFSMADAATDAQFTLKEASEQMRTAVRRNRKYPGVVFLGGNDVALDPEQVSNFKSRMRGKARDDEPMFASGAAGGKGGLQWADMQLDLRKSSIDMVNEANINGLSAVTGMSKTKLGIEQSGVTRDTADVQEGLFIGDHAIPALEFIIDQLNQDYKRNYQDEYKKYGYMLEVESPLEDDKDADIKDLEIRTSAFELYTTLINKGYDEDTAAAFASGEKTLDEIGKPTNPPVVVPVAPTDQTPTDPTAAPNQPAAKSKPEPKPAPAANDHHHEHEVLPAIRNQLDGPAQSTVTQQEAALKNAVINVQHQVVSAVLNKVTKNQFESESDIIDEGDRTAAERELELAIETFYSVIIPLNGSTTMTRRMNEFGKTGFFTLDKEAKQYIEVTATRAAGSHMDTILGDILDTVRTTEERLVNDELKKITPLPGQSSEDVLKLARSKALEGVGREQVAAAIRKEYSDTISKVRATTIARTETNRAFNRSQYEADRQFLAQNDLTGRAYKKWITRSGNPCPFCLAKASEPPIPFEKNFAVVGDVLKATFEKEDGTPSVRQLQVGFEDVQSGNLHPNCACTYQLIIE
jgi:hypothetical protein